MHWQDIVLKFLQPSSVTLQEFVSKTYYLPNQHTHAIKHNPAVAVNAKYDASEKKSAAMLLV